MALSNAHVWGLDLGMDVIQPWFPIDEYLEAIVKLLTCGAAAFTLDTVVPSPLTVGLAFAAAATWAATIYSDAEDPSRWGQRTGPVPPASARTETEVVHVEAKIPERPFPGWPYSAETSWNYTRNTTQGSFSTHVTSERKNEHVLVGKRVWTDTKSYRAGQRVKICAEIAVNSTKAADDYYVVANCFPKSNPERIVRRILIPEQCEPPAGEEVCFHGFPSPARPGGVANFPFDTFGVFHFDSKSSSHFYGPWPQGDPNSVTALAVPISPLIVTIPAASEVTIEVFHQNRPIKADAYDILGQLVDSGSTTDQQNVLHTIRLKGSKIVKVVITAGGTGAFIVGMCFFNNRPLNGARKFTYAGQLDLDRREKPDNWAIELFVQTVNNVPPGTDPAVAAQTIGGITASNNVASVGGGAACMVVMTLDHIFDVI